MNIYILLTKSILDRSTGHENKDIVINLSELINWRTVRSSEMTLQFSNVQVKLAELFMGENKSQLSKAIECFIRFSGFKASVCHNVSQSLCSQNLVRL